MLNNNRVFMKNRLSLAVYALSGLTVLLGTASLPSFAQEESASDIEEVIVSGQRRSIESAQAIKRESEVIVDSVTAVDIGALPDRSVSEALQRIPGVQLQRTNAARDPARLAAEGGAVFVRGLSWVRTELNGRDIFSATNGRSIGFEDVSADLMAGVDVYKTPTANMVEGGIGGTVNLRTRKPFDSNELVLAGSVDYNYAELYEKGFPSVNGLFSNVWDTGAGMFGFLASASLAKIGNRTDSVSTGQYLSYSLEDVNDGNGNSWQEWQSPASADAEDVRWSPKGLGFRRIDWEQERNAFSSVFQWAPNDDVTMTLQALRAEANPEDTERAVGYNTAWGGNITPGSGSDFVYDENGFLQSGSFSDAAVVYNTRYGKREATTTDVSLGLEWQVIDSLKASADIQYVKAEASVLSMAAFNNMTSAVGFADPHSGVDVAFDLSGRPSIVVSDADRQVDPSQYYWGAAMDHIEDNDAKSLVSRLDFEYAFSDDFVKSFAFGARFSDRDAITRQSGWNWSIVSHQFWGGADAALISDNATEWAELYKFDNFYGGDIAVPSVGWLPKQGLVKSNQVFADVMSDVLADTVSQIGWSWSPLTPDTYTDLNPQGDNVSAGINKQNEKTSAAYWMARFGDDNGEVFGVPFDGNFGVRFVRTETSALGRSVAGGVADGCYSNGELVANPTAACEGADAFVTSYRAMYGDYKTYENRYNNALPSMNLRFLLTDDVQARFGLSRAMVRPDFSQTRPYGNLSFSFTDLEFDPTMANGSVGSLTAGAPSLLPTTADQIDASIEWYFAQQSNLTFSAFYKELKNYIRSDVTYDTLTYGGQSYVFETLTQVNGATGELKGFEVGYSQFYDFLPGFGVQANFTYIDNKGGANTATNLLEESNGELVQVAGATNDDLPIEGMSKTSYNLALIYENYNVSARLAYNWRERYLLTTSAANINRPVWFDDYGQLDGSVFYSFNSKLKAGVQVTNLLAEETRLDVWDEGKTGKYSWTQGDRRIAFVVRAQF